MNDDHSTRTEIVYRSIIERLFSEMKKQVQSEEDKQCIKDLKEVKNYFIYFFIFKQLWINKLIDEGIFISKIVMKFIYY